MKRTYHMHLLCNNNEQTRFSIYLLHYYRERRKETKRDREKRKGYIIVISENKCTQATLNKFSKKEN